MPGLIVGSRAQVWHGTADVTTGGLRRNDLVQGKNGRIISKRMMLRGKKLKQESARNGTLAPPFTKKDGGRKPKKKSRSRSQK